MVTRYKNEYDPKAPSFEYAQAVYPTKQLRDCIAGSIAIKNAGELYLPMPGAWNAIPDTTTTLPETVARYGRDFLPWSHRNPAYRAYLQRARFPDLTANALFMCSGIATIKAPEINLPTQLKYLEDKTTNNNESLNELFAFVLSEVLSVGKIALVVDFDIELNKFFIATYTQENCLNYKESKIGVDKTLIAQSFLEETDAVTGYEEIREYIIDDELVISRMYVNSDNPENETILNYQGKPYKRIPVFFAGSFDNCPKPNKSPLLGISDIAISIYQKNADLRQAQFMTCNPTLFVFGIDASEAPKVLGSQVVVAIRNPAGKAEYPKTDTSALQHIQQTIEDEKQEASNLGAALLTSPAKESGEALAIRQANRGTSLVQVVNQVGKAINDAISFIADLIGHSQDEKYFEPNIDFAEALMTSNDLASLVDAWMKGAIDHDTLLDNLRDAGWIDGDKTNDKVKDSIDKEAPTTNENFGDPELDKEKQNNPFMENEDDEKEEKEDIENVQKQ